MNSAISRQEERQHERKGILFAVIFHGVLLLICFFWIVLKQTSATIDEGGSGELVNFGFNELGSGDNNSMDQVATQEATETPSQPQEATEASTDDANLTTTDPNAETVVSETKKPASTTTTTTPTKPTQTTTTPTTNPNAQMGTTTKPGVSSGDGDSKQAGNQGHPDGTLDSKNYYGNPGTGGPGSGGEGGSLSMTGWRAEGNSKVANPELEEGKVVFVIMIDNEGEILSLKVKEKTVTEALVKKCEEQIRNKMEFVKNRDNASTAQSATGTITFVFRVN
jgi:outer membrane biosynthesis protein TonB